MLTLRMSNGASLSLTPEHGLFVDGALVAAAAAKVGSSLMGGDGTIVTVEHVTEDEAVLVINPVTASGTILASDTGAPVLAASHPMWIAASVVNSPLIRAFVNFVILFVGDETSPARFTMFFFARLVGFLVVALVPSAVMATPMWKHGSIGSTKK